MIECEFCKKKINNNEEFVLEGEYPAGWNRYWTAFGLWVGMGSAGPEAYGKIFHKNCYLKKTKK